MSLRFLCLWCLLTLAVSWISRAELRAGASARCALDGAVVGGASRVDLFEGSKLRASFCSVECALAWPAATPPGETRRFEVHEEQNGVALDPRAATFVRSNLRASGGRGALRAFRDALTAAEHVRAFGGTLVPNPFPEDD
ncbi:MAG: hypothetical protein ABI054_09450 [Planctomycetota bacterium]